jgi:hypothetical protein
MRFFEGLLTRLVTKAPMALSGLDFELRQTIT